MAAAAPTLCMIAPILLSTVPANGQCEVQPINEPDGLGVRLHMHNEVAVLVPWPTTLASHYVVVYRRHGLHLVEEAVLFSPDGPASQLFGIDQHVHHDWLAVADKSLNRVYMFRHDDGNWIHEQTVEPPPGGGGRFGHSIAIDGDLMLVGAPWWGTDGVTQIGTAHLYHFDGTAWGHETELPNPDPYEWQPFTHPDHYGWSVALDGDRAVIGANTSHMGAGRAYVYERTGDEWMFTLTLTPQPPDQFSGFGRNVGLSGDLIMVSASKAPAHGRVYIFGPGDGVTWVQGADLPTMVLPSPNFVNANFGMGAALHESGDRFVASVHDDSEAALGAGAAFVLKYVDDEDRWVYQKKLIGSTIGPMMSYGPALAFDGDFVLVGAVNAVNPGQVHLYAGVLEKDCLGTGQPDACDIFDGLAEDSTGSGIPDECEFAGDLNGDGVVDVDDLLILLSLWGECDADSPAEPDSPAGCFGDISHDGQIGIDDLLILLANWG